MQLAHQLNSCSAGELPQEATQPEQLGAIWHLADGIFPLPKQSKLLGKKINSGLSHAEQIAKLFANWTIKYLKFHIKICKCDKNSKAEAICMDE